jgi:hypothetical protein
MALKILGFVVLVALGVAGGYFLRPPVEQWLTGRGEVEASVIEERREEDRLVLSLRSGDQTMMATFRERIDDVAELVEVGDVVTLRVGGHGVFADDVPIVRVQRPPPPPPPRRRRRSEESEGETVTADAEASPGAAPGAHDADPPNGAAHGPHASEGHGSAAHGDEARAGEAPGEAHADEAHAGEQVAERGHGHAS